jgi:hypothetical protein
MYHESNEYKTCAELIEKYPDVDILGWDARNLGIYHAGTLLIGKRSGRESKTLIYEPSFLELMEFANNQLFNRRVYTKK